MASNNVDPGGGNHPPSYSSRVKKNISSYKKLDRNVLIVFIEKKSQEDVLYLNGDQVSNVCALIGLSVTCDTQGYQAQYGRKGITLSVWCKPGVSLERLVTEEPRVFTDQLTITSVRPAVRREVSVLVTGLHFNTPDTQVKEYLESFGAKVSGEPVYSVHKEGPWKGQFNGDRRYRADFTSQKLPMGTYHLVDGAKVRVLYPGNTRTCARCHQGPSLCPGGGMARDCAQLGGQRQPLIAHMRQLWARVDFMPGEEGGQGMDEEDEVEEAGGLGDTRSALAQTAAAVSVGGDSGNAVDPAQEAEGDIMHQTENMDTLPLEEI